MADYEVRTVTETRIEVALRSPTNWVEVSKALAYCRQAQPSDYDDAVTVEARDDKIVLWWITEVQP